MATRINPIASQLQVTEKSKLKQVKEVKKLPESEENSGLQVSKSTAIVPWATAAGHSLYEKVQKLPEGISTGSPEQTSPDKEKAMKQGVGRKVDRYA